MAHVTERDLGYNAIRAQLRMAGGMEVAVGILAGSKNEGHPIAEYAADNEYGTDRIPSRPFMRTAFDENRADIQADFTKQSMGLLQGKRTAHQTLTIIGQKQADRIKNTITDRDFLPRLSPVTVARKKGSEKTLVDTGAMVNAVQISVRAKTA
jgi:hypothetical protein